MCVARGSGILNKQCARVALDVSAFSYRAVIQPSAAGGCSKSWGSCVQPALFFIHPRETRDDDGFLLVKWIISSEEQTCFC